MISRHGHGRPEGCYTRPWDAKGMLGFSGCIVPQITVRAGREDAWRKLEALRVSCTLHAAGRLFRWAVSLGGTREVLRERWWVDVCG